MSRFTVLASATFALLVTSDISLAWTSSTQAAVAGSQTALSERPLSLDASFSELQKAEADWFKARTALAGAKAKIACSQLAQSFANAAADNRQEASLSIQYEASQLINRCGSLPSGKPMEIIALFNKNPNPAVRAAAQAATAKEDLRRNPIQLKFTSVEGQEVDLAKWRGRVVLIDFRGILHCAACEADEPMLKAAYTKYHKHGFEIISIADDKPRDFMEGGKHGNQTARQVLMGAIKKHGLRWPTQWDGTDAVNTYFARWGVMATPTYFIINKEGLLVEPLESIRDPQFFDMSIRYYLGLDVMARE